MSPHLPAPSAVWSAGSSHYLHWSLHHLFPFCCQSWQPINAVLHAACTFLLTGSAGHLLSTQSIPSGSQPYISQDTLTASPSLALIFLVVCVLFSLSRTRMVLQVASPVSIWYCSIIQYVYSLYQYPIVKMCHCVTLINSQKWFIHNYSYVLFINCMQTEPQRI